MAQKPMQDIFTVVLAVAFILVVVVAGVTTVTMLEESGIMQSGITLTGVVTDGVDSPTNSVPADEPAGYDDCEVVYYQAPQLDEYASIASETEEDDLAAMYYAVYICTGSSASAGNYI